DGVEHRNERRPLRVERLRQLREAEAADAREALEEARERAPRDRARGQRGAGLDLAQPALDLSPALEHRLDLGGRDACAAAVRPPEVLLAERGGRRRALGHGSRVRLDERERRLEAVRDLDTVTKEDAE